MKRLLILSFILLGFAGFGQMATAPNQVTQIGIERNIQAQLAAGITVTTSAGSGTFQLICATSSVTSSGAITTGARAILLETSGDFSGIIDGNRFLGNGFMSMPLSTGAIYPAVNYTISAGTLYIKKWN